MRSPIRPLGLFAAVASFLLLAVPALAEPASLADRPDDAAKALPTDRELPIGWQVQRNGNVSAEEAEPPEQQLDRLGSGAGECDLKTALGGAPTGFLASVEARAKKLTGQWQVLVAIAPSSPEQSVVDAFTDFAGRCSQVHLEGAAPSADDESAATRPTIDASTRIAPAPEVTADRTVGLDMEISVTSDKEAVSKLLGTRGSEYIAELRGVAVIVVITRSGPVEADPALIAYAQKLFVTTVQRLHDLP